VLKLAQVCSHCQTCTVVCCRAGPRAQDNHLRSIWVLQSLRPQWMPSKLMAGGSQNKIGELQREDESLMSLFKKTASGKVSNLCDEQYVIVNEVLYLQANDVTRLIVPKCCRPLVLHLAHTIPWADHLGQQKTLASVHVFIGLHFTLTYRHTTTHVQHVRKPMSCLSGAEHACTLSLLSLLPLGASPLWILCSHMRGQVIIQALVQLFSRLRFPEKMLTYQRINFTLRLMGQLHSQLGILAIRTSAYHTQTEELGASCWQRRGDGYHLICAGNEGSA